MHHCQALLVVLMKPLKPLLGSDAEGATSNTAGPLDTHPVQLASGAGS